MTLVTLWTALVRSRGLDPQSLWFDDLWVASLTRLDSLLEAVSLAVPVPPGFVGALWVSKRLVPDPEMSLQLVPFLAALAGIPLVALLAVRVSGSYAIGVAAGVLMAINPTIAHYSVFVKQYAVDQLVTAILLLLAARYFRTCDTAHLRAGALAGAAGLLFSFPSVFVSVPFVNLALLGELAGWRVRSRELGSVLRTAAAFNLAVVAIVVLFIRGRSNGQVVGYWRGGFVPTESLGSLWGFLRSNGLEALQGAIPPLLVAGTPLVALGLVSLLARQPTRRLGVLIVLFYAAVVVASALEAYPIAGGVRARTSVFAYPVTVLLLSVGAHALTAWLPGRSVVHTAGCLLLIGLMVLKPVGASYFRLNHSKFVRLMEQVATPSDGMVIWPSAGYLAGYYSSWPITAFVPTHLGGGLQVEVSRPGTLTLPLGAPAVRTAALDKYLAAGRYERVLYLTTRAGDGEEKPVFDCFERHGYTAHELWSSNVRTRLVVFQRAN